MYLDKYDKATKILNREVENFSNQKNMQIEEEKELIEKNYQKFEYEPYEKQEGFTPIREGLDIGGSIIRALQKPFQPLIDFFNDLIEAFKSIPKRVAAFGDAFKDVGDGIKLEFVNLGKGIDLGFNDFFNVVGILGQCGIKSLKNFRSCIMWYILDWIGTTLYAVFVELPVFVIKKFSGIDLQPYVDMIICFIKEIDAVCFEYTCYHFIHFPDWVIEDCYSCKFEESVAKLSLDWNETIPNLLNEPKRKFKSAERNFKKTFGSARDLDD